MHQFAETHAANKKKSLYYCIWNNFFSPENLKSSKNEYDFLIGRYYLLYSKNTKSHFKY